MMIALLVLLWMFLSWLVGFCLAAIEDTGWQDFECWEFTDWWDPSQDKYEPDIEEYWIDGCGDA